LLAASQKVHRALVAASTQGLSPTLSLRTLASSSGLSFFVWRNSQEPSVGTTNSNVEDEVEALVEWRVAGSGCAPRPRVGKKGLVLGHFLKLAKLVERLLLLVTDEEDLLDPTVDVEVDVFLGPLDAVGVVSI
jgi:hypothetical protein